MSLTAHMKNGVQELPSLPQIDVLSPLVTVVLGEAPHLVLSFFFARGLPLRLPSRAAPALWPASDTSQRYIP